MALKDNAYNEQAMDSPLSESSLSSFIKRSISSPTLTTRKNHKHFIYIYIDTHTYMVIFQKK